MSNITTTAYGIQSFYVHPGKHRLQAITAPFSVAGTHVLQIKIEDDPLNPLTLTFFFDDQERAAMIAQAINEAEERWADKKAHEEASSDTSTPQDAEIPAS